MREEEVLFIFPAPRSHNMKFNRQQSLALDPLGTFMNIEPIIFSWRLPYHDRRLYHKLRGVRSTLDLNLPQFVTADNLKSHVWAIF